MFKTYDEMVAMALKYAPLRLAVAGAHEDAVIEAVKEAQDAGLVKPVLIGIKDKIIQIAKSMSYDINPDDIIDIEAPDKCASEAVKLVSSGSADIVMKGLIQTGTMMKAVLNKETGLRSGKIISHIFFIRLEGYHKFLALSDGGINIAPELPEQISILENAIDFYHLIGLEKPKIAVLAPVETVSEKIPSTMYGALLSKMSERGQIAGAVIDGPLAFDNAISKRSAEEKKIVSEVAGDADLIFVSDIDMGNGLFKGLIYFGKGIPAAVVLGTKAPVIITSRADSSECKFLSIALNVLYAGKLKDRQSKK